MVTINAQDTQDMDVINKTMDAINEVVREPEIGKIYKVKVLNVESFGVFVELWHGCEGFIHVSKLDKKRVNHPKDVVKVGDIVEAKAIEWDKKGKINLTLVLEDNKPEKKDKEVKE